MKKTEVKVLLIGYILMIIRPTAGGISGGDLGGDGMTTKSKYAPQERYQKENIQRVVIKLNKRTDADILEHLENIENRQGYIKELIRNNIKDSHS